MAHSDFLDDGLFVDMAEQAREEQISEDVRALCEDLEYSEEHLDEIETQFGSECSLYGDGWPGAQLDIERSLAHVNSLRARLNMKPRANRTALMLSYGRRHDTNPDFF
jgi:hypothetical protein